MVFDTEKNIRLLGFLGVKLDSMNEDILIEIPTALAVGDPDGAFLESLQDKVFEDHPGAVMEKRHQGLNPIFAIERHVLEMETGGLVDDEELGFRIGAHRGSPDDLLVCRRLNRHVGESDHHSAFGDVLFEDYPSRM